MRLSEHCWRRAGEKTSKLVELLLAESLSGDTGSVSVSVAPYSMDPSDTWRYVSPDPSPPIRPDHPPLLGDVFGANGSYAGLFYWSAGEIVLQLDSGTGETDVESIAADLLPESPGRGG